jgi:hypothetical protein
MDVPEPVSRAAAWHRLGAPRRVSRQVGPWAYARLFAGGLAMAGFMTYWTVDAARAWSGGWEEYVLVAILAGAVAFGVGVSVTAVVRAIKTGAVDLYEFDGGLVRTTAGGVTAFRWSEVEFVEAVYWKAGAEGSGHLSRNYLVRRRDGSAHVPIERAADAGHLADRIAEVARPATEQRLASGAEVAFGAIVLGPRRLAVRGESIAWPEVDRVVRESGPRGEVTIAIYRRREPKPWASAPIGTVPDARVAVELAARTAERLNQRPSPPEVTSSSDTPEIR